MIKTVINPPKTDDPKEIREFYKTLCKIINKRLSGDYWEWYDTDGKKRTHTSKPSSDSDGTIIGTQS